MAEDRVNGLLHAVSSGILTLGIHKVFLYLAKKFALTQKSWMCLCGDDLSITVGAVVAASGENVGQATSSGDNKIRLVPPVRPRMFP